MSGNISFGSSAYDFRERDTYNPEAYSVGNAIKTEKNQKKIHMAPLAVTGALLSAAMLCFGLLARSEINAVSNDTVAVMKRIEVLRQENARLELACSQQFTTQRIEEFAIEQLGMQKPGCDQIIYIDSSCGMFLP